MTATEDQTSRAESFLPAALAVRPLFLVKRLRALLTEAIDAQLAPLDIDVREFTVLVLLDSEGPRTQQRISERLRIDRTTVVSLVDSLQAKELLTRNRDPQDRRVYIVAITPAGTKLRKRATPKVETAENQVLGHLTAKQRAGLIDHLQAAVTPPTAGRAD